MSDTPKPPAPTRASTLALKDARTIGEALMTAQFQRAVADAAPQHMTASRLMSTFRQAARNNPAFDQCNLMSVLGVFMTCTFLGLEPNTPQGHAYMIPFARKRFDRATRQMVDDGYDLQLIIGYQGMIDLAYRSDRVQSIAAHAVYEGDDFSFEYGSNEHLQHRPKGLHAEGDIPRYFYGFSKLRAGQAFEVLPTSAVLRIRNSSQGFRAALAAKEKAEEKRWKIPGTWTEAPWVKHFDAMGRKTAMRALYKWLPKTTEMAAAQRLDEAQDRHMLDFGPVLEGSVNPLDEDLPALREERADPGAAFGERGQGDGEETQQQADPPPAPRQTRPREPAKPKPEAPPPPTDSAPPDSPPLEGEVVGGTAAPSQGFDAEIFDEDGAAVGRYTDPVQYAEAYRDLWRSTAPPLRDGLSEYNADALAQAYEASGAAAAVLDDMAGAAPGPAPSADAPVAVAVPEVNGKPSLPGYLSALRQAADQQSAESMDAWAQAQRPVIDGLSALTQRNAQRTIADRRTALGLDKPPARAEPAASAPQPAADDAPPPPTEFPKASGTRSIWTADAKWIIDQIDAAKTVHEVEALAGNAAVVAKLNGLGADEHLAVQSYAKRRLESLQGGGVR